MLETESCFGLYAYFYTEVMVYSCRLNVPCKSETLTMVSGFGVIVLNKYSYNSCSSTCHSGVGKENSAHTLCEYEALASLRHAHLGSFFLEPEDIRSLGLGAIWNYSKVAGLL